MNNENSSNFIGTENISKLLIKFSLPAIVGMVVSTLYNIVDRIFISQGINTLALSAITIAFPIMNILIAFSMLIGIGASASISIKLGESKKEDAQNILGNAISLTIVLSFILSIVGLLFLEPILILFGASGEILTYSKEFMSVILIGGTFGNLAYSINNIIRSEGKPKKAMKTMFVGTIINIVLNPIFIFLLDLGVKGSALATIISQIISCIFVLNYFLMSKNNSILKIKKKNLFIKKKIAIEIISIGLSPFILQITSSLISIIINRKLSEYGTDISIAVMGVINSTSLLILMPIFGINQGAQPIIGYNYGSKQFDRVKKTLRLIIILTPIISTIGYLFVAIFPEFIIAIFTDDINSNTKSLFLSEGIYGLRVNLCMLPVVGFQIISSHYFQSVNKPKYSILLSLTRQIIILLPFLFIFPEIFGLYGIFIAGPVSDFLSFLVIAIFLYKETKILTQQPLAKSA